MATLKDVAGEAGVSVATVSCCLSGARNVSPKTRQKIMDAVEKLKYVPNMAARDLKRAKSRKIGVILTDIDNTCHAEILKGISSCLQSRGYDISVAFSNGFPDVECEKIKNFISGSVSGMILVTSQPQNTELFSEITDTYHIPAVFVERRPAGEKFRFAGFDNAGIIRYFTETLIEKGYENIALVSGETAFSSEAEALSGYREALQKKGLPLRTEMIRTTDMTKEGAFKAFFSLPEPEQTDAVIATSENIAWGIAEACRIRGCRCPRDIQIITFTEESWSQAARIPGIIYIPRSSFTLGTKAAELLVKCIGSSVSGAETRMILPDEHVRDKRIVPARKIRSAGMAEKREPLRILMADMATSEAVALLSENFTLLTDVPVETEFLAQEKMLAAIGEDLERKKPLYDIYMYDIPWLPYMVQNGCLTDISWFVSESGLAAGIFPQNMENCRYEGRCYGIPIVGGAQIMFYRRDLFENRQIQKEFEKQFHRPLVPPQTWSEFNEAAFFFTRRFNPDSPTLYGTSVAGNVDEALAPEMLIRIWAHGGRLWDQYNRVCLNSPENEAAFESILQTITCAEQSPADTSIEMTVQDFCSGKTAMLITYTEYSSRISRLLHDNTVGRVGYGAVPGHAPAGVGWNLGMNPYTKKEREVYRYFQWLCRKDISVYMTILDGQSPAAAPYHSPELMKLYPWLELTEESFRYCRKRTGPYARNALVIPPSRIEAVLCQAVRDVLKRGVSVSEALEEGQKNMTRLFKAYGYPKPLHLLG